jgi:hypothetical protein
MLLISSVDITDPNRIEILDEDQFVIASFSISSEQQCGESFGILVKDERGTEILMDEFAERVQDMYLVSVEYDTAAEVRYKRGRNSDRIVRPREFERDAAFFVLRARVEDDTDSSNCSNSSNCSSNQDHVVVEYHIEIFNEHNGYYPHYFTVVGPNGFSES